MDYVRVVNFMKTEITMKLLLILAIIYPVFSTDFSYEARKLDNNIIASKLRPKMTTSSPRVKLSDTPECADDIRHICPASILNNNFAVLDCLQNDKRREDADLSSQCHHLIWTFKRNLTLDTRFVTTAKHMCKKFIESQKECVPLENVKGHLLSCLMNAAENATEAECRAFLKKMEAIVFSDYRLIYKFTDECQSDIEKFQCGRLEMDSEDPHSQGETIECLSKQSDKLSPLCKHEILRIAELQGDDFHLDRPLFFACRDDRERFCEKVEAGEGKVYRCLMRHKMERDMSQECREKLFQREKLVVHDYKISRGLAKACRENIKIYHCRDDTSDRREIRLAQILLCLENALHKGYPVAGECQAEMLEHRQTLLENYQLTPELAAACEKDVHTFCGRRLELGGKTLHCLMEHAKPSRIDSGRISDSCRRELESLLKQSDVGEDWRVDPVLQEACQPVVDAVCSHEKPGEGRVMSCLMKHFDSTHMSLECKEKLLQIQYFVSRDFKLDPILYKRCRADAEKHCHAKKNWHDKPSRMDPERGPMVLPCLYRYAYHPDKNVQLSRECLYEVRRVMRQRAVSVDLMPEIEEPCLLDLTERCSENVEKGEEMMCLQKSLKDLYPDCQKVVANYTEEESEHLELNYPLFYACSTILHKHCNDLLAKDVDQGDLIQCLILHKNEPEMKMNAKCRVSVEHFQLISLKNYRFSYKFKEACKKDVLHLCKNVKTKPEVISCLSGIVTNDTVFEKTHRISRECRQQLKIEQFERDESIKLDPALNDACSEDQKTFCSNVRQEEAHMLECLKNHQKSLSSACHKSIFNREKEEMVDNAIDYALITTCKPMIKKYCSDTDLSQILDCLREKRDDNGMDRTCRKIIIKRMVEQNSDYRLNPRLKQACVRDIPKFCSTVIADHKDGEEFEGKVINCLKQQYRKNKKLSRLCENEIVRLMRDVALDYNLDPQLVQACSFDIQKKCSDEPNIEECLKIKFQKKELEKADCRREVARLIFEGKADIQSDPLLYRVCITDIKHFCSEIPAGHGRQLSCLLTILEGDPPSAAALSEECKTMLSKRVQMFEYAAQVAPAESVGDLIRQVAISPSRNYIIVVILGCLTGIFVGGLFCGRVTKRVTAMEKNK
ncbi:Golgi apparatus protein 1 [Parasteatoda tepidariorum]|uniref:Golgi apparatus protein 1 n=1 Tax=Parasteatoda tepidariorum TaxID=114398 RepID=UPI00077FA1CC|nr:Golgi apparatus protein 1 [Parasteatoda tepidariorum]